MIPKRPFYDHVEIENLRIRTVTKCRHPVRRVGLLSGSDRNSRLHE